MSREGLEHRLVAVAVAVLIGALAGPSVSTPTTANASGGAASDQSAAAAKKKCKRKKGGKKRCRRRAATTPQAVAPLPQTPAAAQLSIRSDPALFPNFDPEVIDYVVRCTGEPVTISGNTPPTTSVAVDGHGPFTGQFAHDVELSPNQAFSLQTSRDGAVVTHQVRCLPPGFPAWTFDRLEQPSQEFYVVSPTLRPTPGDARYVVVFDDHGAPVWWYAPTAGGQGIFDAKALSNGNIAWAVQSGYELRQLDGTLTRLASFVGAPTDPHDLQEAENGNLLVMSYKERATPEDLSPIGGPSSALVRDSAIQELDASGNVVWEWNSKDHIGIDEITQPWWDNALDNEPYDIVHMNAIEPSGDSLITSLRFTDAVYSVNRATGAVEWKLGGATIPESLTVVGDPHGAYPLSGQHDARILEDGTLTVHDNANHVAHPPRAVRYVIDETARTATLLEAIEDPEVPTAGCCGGARRSPTGSWLMSWGQRSQVTEFAADGDRAFRLGFGPLTTGPFSYRAFPVPAGLLDAEALRAGMSSMFPR